MNKKYLSVILFGALMLGTTGTFTSCKDYDDDISNLQTQITANADAIKALQDKVNNGMWVTSVAAIEGGFTITFSDGQSYQIVNGKNGENGQNGQNGKDGTQITIGEDGYWYFDGEKSEYKAVADKTAKVKPPYIDEEDGYWYFYNEEGVAEKSEYKANGAAYAVENNGFWTLYMPDASGVMQTIKLPGAGSVLSDVVIVGSIDDAGATDIKDLKPIEFHAYKPTATSNWKGNKPNLTGKEILTAYEPNVIVRLNPNTVDPDDLSFTLVNSKGDAAPVDVALKAWDGKISSNKPVTKAASSNGMYTLSLEGQALAPNKAVDAWLNANVNKYFFTSNVTASTNKTADCIAYALSERSGMISPFDLTFNYNATDQTITSFNFYDLTAGVLLSADPTNPTGVELEVGHTYRVVVNDDTFLYDSYLEFTNAAALRWGISYDKASEPMIFTVTSQPDKMTAAQLNITMHYLTKKGGAQTDVTLYANPKSTLTSGVVLCDEVAYERKKNNDFFVVSLDELWKALGTAKTADWVEDAKLTLAAADWVIVEGNSAKSQNGVEVDYAKNANGAAPANTGEAKYLKVAFGNPANQISGQNSELPLNKSYNLILNMPAKAGTDYSGDVIGTVIIPFKLTKPDLNTILVKESGVFKSDNLATAYMYHADATVLGSGNAPSDYKIFRSFTDLKNKLDNVGMSYTFSLDNNTKITNSLTSDALADITNGTDASTAKITLDAAQADPSTGYPRGYKQNLIVKFTGQYLGITESSYKYEATYQYCIMSPILEGEAVAANNLIKVSATGKTKIYKENIWAKTYNNDVKYDIFAKGGTTGSEEWYREDIKKVVFSSGNVNVFEVTVDTPTVPVAATTTTEAVPSYIEVEGLSENTAKLNVAVTDIWGYTLNSSVNIQTTLNTGN